MWEIARQEHKVDPKMIDKYLKISYKNFIMGKQKLHSVSEKSLSF